MSAIFGIVNPGGRPADRRELELMSVALAAHGPDGGGCWIGERVGLGQRLTCFTPEDHLERQPLVSLDTQHVLVTDGRIDNRPELTRELEIPLPEAATMPDSGFILLAYRKWGQDCPRHLVGDFTFALCDLHEDKIMIARSPMSTRTVFYHAAAGRFVFSSAPKGLFALPWITREIDKQGLADYMVWATHEPGVCLYGGVRELAGGHMMVVRADGHQVRPYWPPDPGREIRFARDSDYVEAFNEILTRVTSDHLRSLTPVGLLMSGGLDSSSIAATAAALLAPEGKRLATFTEVPRAGFDKIMASYHYADETPFVKAIARMYPNLDLNFIRTGRRFFLDGIEPFFAALEAPFRASWNKVWWETCLSEAGHQGVRVVLTGVPGNLTMSLDGEGLFPQLLRQGKWLRAFREALACSRQEGGTSVMWSLARGVEPYVPTPLWRLVQRLRFPHDPIFHASQSWRAFSPIHPEFAKSQRVAERAMQSGYDFYGRGGPDTRAGRYAAVGVYNYSGSVSRGYEALLGVQSRNLPADRRIIEYCLSLPEEQHQRQGVSRSLIRRAMAGRLPPEVLGNRRRGHQAADWFETASANRPRMFEELALLERSALATEALDLSWIRKLVGQMPETGVDVGKGRETVDYHTVLGAAFMTGRFLRWIESTGNVGASGREGSQALALPG